MKGSGSPGRHDKLLDKDELKIDLDSFDHGNIIYLLYDKTTISILKLFTDLSNDSYSTVNMGLDDGASPHSGRGSYMHGSASPPPYLSSHSPTPMGPAGHGYSSYPDNIVYTSIGQPPNHHSGSHNHAGVSDDMSNDSSPAHGYPDFPPSPDSWLGDSAPVAHTANAATAVHYN